MQENEIPLRPSENQEITQERLQIQQASQYVQHIMQKHNLQCWVMKKRKWKSQGESVIVAPNLLKRNFTAVAPNEKWVMDITNIQYGSSTLYLSTIMDLYNNEIVAYKLYDHQQTPLVIDTLKEALELQGYPEEIIIHSDQGSVYTSYAYQELIKRNTRRAACRVWKLLG